MMTPIWSTSGFNTSLAVVLAVITAASFWLTVYNSWKQRRWGRRMADLVTTAFLSSYWGGLAIARLFFGYVGPSIQVTVIGSFVFVVVCLHFLGIAVVQRNVNR